MSPLSGALLRCSYARRAEATRPMPSHCCRPPAPRTAAASAGFRFPPEVMMLAVRWYLPFGLSYRDMEELPAERGIEVDHVTV